MRRLCASLHEKYSILLALKVRREEAEAAGLNAFPQEERRERKELFRSVARRFPGSLRELETSTSAALRERLALVERGLGGALLEEEGLRLKRVWDVHLYLRLAAAARRWMRRRAAPTPAEFISYCRRFEAKSGVCGGAGWIGLDDIIANLGVPADDLLGFLSRPPGGRLLPLVEAAVSRSSK